MKQNAILINEFSKKNDDWVYGKIEIPEPKEGEVQIKVKYAALNPVDWKLKHAYLPDYPHSFPLVLGWDASGIIEKIGKGVKGLKIGDEVFTYCKKDKLGKFEGTYCEYICVSEKHVALKPKKFGFDKAAGVPLTALTAYQALEAAKPKKGESVLILGSSGGVGSWGIQFSSIFGLKSIGVASTKNHEYIKKLGGTYTIDYKKDVIQEVKKLFPNGVDLILDFFGHDGLKKYEGLVKKGGRMVGIVEPEYKSALGLPYQFVFVQPNAEQLTKIAIWIDEDKLSLNIEKEYNFKEIQQATKNMMEGGIRGKIVLKVNP